MRALDTSEFIQSIFTVTLNTAAGTNGDFHSYADIIGWSSQNDGQDVTRNGVALPPGAPGHDDTMALIFADIGDDWNALPAYFSKGKCRDTSLGGNDAINCYPQFNETDDVAEHPFLSTYPGDPGSGMGRVYSEVYDDQQQIMYITFGVPQFNSLASFYSNAVLGKLALIMNNGDGSGVSELGYIVGETVGTFVTLPVLPLVFIYKILGGLSNANITKYYDFKSAMPLYYRAVNSMIQHLAINMGLSKDTVLVPSGSSVTAGGNISNTTVPQQAARAIQTNDGTSTKGLPPLFSRFGPDIYRIMLRKYRFMASDFDPSAQHTSDWTLNQPGTSDDPVVNVSDEGKSFTDNFFSTFVGQLYDATLYIGFRIEKGVDTSETFSSETGESSIAQQINSQAQSARDLKFKFANGNIAGGLLKGLYDGLAGLVHGVADSVGASVIDTVLAGNGVVDFPDVWKSSSFSKNYTFNMSLRSPYGDPYSILQNLYVPLALLLGGSMPRAIGASAYTSPFICRAYCKGMFAVSLGMITHVTIKRGADQFGWNTQRLPTCIDVSFEIKDLSPAMFLAIGDGGTWSALKEVFGTNSNFQEYLMTLSGMGLSDRLSWIRNLRRKATYLFAQVTSTKLSPFYWGATLGNTIPAKILSNFMPATKVPNN